MPRVQNNGAILVISVAKTLVWKKVIKLSSRSLPAKFETPESPEAKYWREKYEITTFYGSC